MRDADFEAMVRRHGQDLYGYLLYRTGDHHLAEELVGDTLERAYRARDRYDSRKASEKTWLITIGLNRWRDVMRRKSGERTALEQLGGVTAPAVGDMSTVEDRRALLDELSALPDEEREVVALSYGADLTAKQIAQVLGLPPTTVQGRLYRGLRRMREQLGSA